MEALEKISAQTTFGEVYDLEDFLNGLSPDDVGDEVMGPYIVAFEGFTHDCWEDAEAKGKSLDDLEDEILGEWQKKYKTKPIQSGWARGGEFGEDDIFYAVFLNKQKLSWQMRPEISVGDKVKVIADTALLKTIHIVGQDDVGEGVVKKVAPDDAWPLLSNIFYRGVIIIDSPSSHAWFFPYSHWREFLEVVEYGKYSSLEDKLSWSQDALNEHPQVGDKVKVIADKELLRPIGMSDTYTKDTLLTVETINPDTTWIVFTDDGEKQSAYTGNINVSGWVVPLSHWREFIEIVEPVNKKAWQQHLDPKDIWDGKVQMPDLFWEDCPEAMDNYLNFYFDTLPEHIKQQFIIAVKKWEDYWRKKKLSWQIIFEPAKEVANLMYALSGVDFPTVASMMSGLADISISKIAEALNESGHPDTAIAFTGFIADCLDAVDGAMTHLNTDSLHSQELQEYIATLPDYEEMYDRWYKIADILKLVAAPVINRTTSSIGKHVAWLAHYDVDEGLKVVITNVFSAMKLEPEINIAPFTTSFGGKYIAALTVLLKYSDYKDLYEQVMWLREKSDMFLDKAINAMNERNVNTIEFEDVLGANEKNLMNEYESKYRTIYYIFQNIVGGENA